MKKKELQPVEIYPKILVYKNMFEDISRSYKILTDALIETEDRLFSPWTQWSIFGTYLNPIFPEFAKHRGDNSSSAKSKKFCYRDDEKFSYRDGRLY